MGVDETQAAMSRYEGTRRTAQGTIIESITIANSGRLPGNSLRAKPYPVGRATATATHPPKGHDDAVERPTERTHIEQALVVAERRLDGPQLDGRRLMTAAGGRS